MVMKALCIWTRLIILEIDWNRVMNLSVTVAQVRKQAQWRSIQVKNLISWDYRECLLSGWQISYRRNSRQFLNQLKFVLRSMLLMWIVLHFMAVRLNPLKKKISDWKRFLQVWLEISDAILDHKLWFLLWHSIIA